MLEAGRSQAPHEARWAVEDAWCHPLVLARWTTFARGLSAEQCEALVARATARRLGTAVVERLSTAQATDGWNLDSRGYVPHALWMRRSPARAAAGADAARQADLPLR